MRRRKRMNNGFDLKGTTKTIVGGAIAVSLINSIKK